jgi:integrase
MLFRLVQPVKRSGSSCGQFQKRIPRDLVDRVAGTKLAIPIGSEVLHLTVSERAQSIRFSLRTSDPTEIKIRHAQAAAYLEEVFRALREARPAHLTRAQAVALSGDLYRGWVNGEANGRVRTIVAEVDENGARIIREGEFDEAEADGYAAMVERFDALRDAGNEAELERALGPVVDRLLATRGIPKVDRPSRAMLFEAFLLAARDAMAVRERQARYDFSPDPIANRFLTWESATPRPAGEAPRRVSLSGLVEDWWKEAEATGRKPSTHESYANTMKAFRAFLKHDDAGRVTPEDVIAFKDHRLASVNPRTGKPISPKTVKDSDLAALKAIFDWAVVNRKMATNPAAGITLKVGKRQKLREKGFTDDEAKALLKAASEAVPGNDHPKTAAAKRWVPWLMAYSGARVGEMAQLRKEDIAREGDDWTMTITPDAGTVKTNEARRVVIHPHVIEMGFGAFVKTAKAGHLFLTPAASGKVRGPLQGLKNRLTEAAREVVKDRNVAPNHGWRHRFKTVGLQAGIDHRILDAIQGHAPKTQGETYGDVTLKTMAAAMAKMPRYAVG